MHKTYSESVQETQVKLLIRDRGIVERDWQIHLENLQLTNARLLWRKPDDASRRTYAEGKFVYKISLVNYPEIDGRHTLAHEYCITRDLDLPHTPRPVKFSQSEFFEMAVYEHIDAKPLHLVSLNYFLGLSILYQMAVIIWKVSWRGVSHNDINYNNVLIDGRSRVFLIDFGAATRTARITAFYRNFLKFTDREHGFYGSFLQLVKSIIEELLPSCISKLLRSAHAVIWTR